MVRRAVILSLATLSVVPFTSAHAQSNLKDRSVLVGQDAYVLLPPELACAQTVVEAKWSSDGRYVLALCRMERVTAPLARARALNREPGDPPGDLCFVVWGTQTHTPKELWRRPIGKAKVEEWQWLPASDRAYAVITEEPVLPGGDARRAVWWIRAGLATARIASTIPPDHVPTHEGEPRTGACVEASESAPLAVVRQWTQRQRETKRDDGTKRVLVECEDVLASIREDGTLAAPLRLPGVSFVAWSTSGRTCYLSRIDVPADPKERPTFAYFEYDPSTGKVDQLPQPPQRDRMRLKMSYAPGQAPDPEPPPMASNAYPVRLASSAGEVKHGDTAAPLRPLWLVADRVSDKARAFVCADASWSQIAPGGDAVLYVSQGAAWVRPILKISVADYAAMEREELRRKVVADASVLATALMNMVGSGEYYPKPDQLRDWLLPYLKGDEGLLGELVYTHGPGLGLFPPDVAAKTVVGHVLGRGGRAVIYADGLAVWRDD